MELPALNGFGHIDLAVSDMDRSIRWWDEVTYAPTGPGSGHLIAVIRPRLEQLGQCYASEGRQVVQHAANVEVAGVIDLALGADGPAKLQAKAQVSAWMS